MITAREARELYLATMGELDKQIIRSIEADIKVAIQMGLDYTFIPRTTSNTVLNILRDHGYEVDTQYGENWTVRW